MATDTHFKRMRSDWTVEDLHRRVSLTLLLMRIGVFIMMIVWVIDKFVNPQHFAAVSQGFYGISIPGNTVAYIAGAIQLAIVVGFLLGFRKRITYGLVLIMHAASTLVAYRQYLNPYAADAPNILFFAAWPVLAACFALYYLRDLDTRLALD
jgi:uncharacterized membrane protein YphA (DoxX/SURF4 family)